MNNIITKTKIEIYHQISLKALEISKKSVVEGKNNEAQSIFIIVECYLKDSVYFKNKKDYINSFACLNYAHGWLDCGARLKIYKVNDNNLFSV